MYTQQRFVLMALDPVHIGTGGYRLGRVDLSIAREPGSNLPKIPGTSLAGAARSYAALRYESPCAGQGGGEQKHCGERSCPICYTFGHVRGSEGGNAGAVSLADAQLLLCPVHSMAGPVWVSTAGRLTEAGFTVRHATEGATTGQTFPTLLRGECATTLKNSQNQPWSQPLNLGWLLLTVSPGAPAVTAPALCKLPDTPAWQAVEKKLVLVEEGLFSQIVNSNLEVRTSVSIDPHTGAAKDGALFTYEALPRASWLWCDVVEDNYRERREPFPKDDPKAKELGHECPLAVVKAGLSLAEYLGIGGMGTRGFGRIKLLDDWEVSLA